MIPFGYMQFFGESYLETTHHQSKYDHDQQWISRLQQEKESVVLIPS